MGCFRVCSNIRGNDIVCFNNARIRSVEEGYDKVVEERSAAIINSCALQSVFVDGYVLEIRDERANQEARGLGLR
ncbi:hypothetical protein SUGI_1025570 [Cryptomeria japonica]|nr:hypothetical protein SUGI_1025570 [Cryptomeria japonica]